MNSQPEIHSIQQLVVDLTSHQTRENALLELSKKRETFPDLAIYLWYSFGTVASLLQEVISIYHLLSPPSLTAHASNRVCNALALLQCVASHQDTRQPFLDGKHLFFRISSFNFSLAMLHLDDRNQSSQKTVTATGSWRQWSPLDNSYFLH